MQTKVYTFAIFLNLYKAFDTANHEMLFKRLYLYGVKGCCHDWFASYFSDRTQTTYTFVDSIVSNKMPINSGVPQGSILGPLLFLLYVNDIMNCSTLLKFHLFADTNILYLLRCPRTLERIFNRGT